MDSTKIWNSQGYSSQVQERNHGLAYNLLFNLCLSIENLHNAVEAYSEGFAGLWVKEGGSG